MPSAPHSLIAMDEGDRMLKINGISTTFEADAPVVTTFA